METIGRSWHRSSNFKAFFKKQSCPSAIRFCAEFFTTLIQPQDRNALAVGSNYLPDDSSHDDDDETIFQGKEERITPELRTLFTRSVSKSTMKIPAKANAVTHIRHRGTAYSIFKRHEGNSRVMIEGMEAPFCIEKIFRFPDSTDDNVLQGTWLIIRSHQSTDVASTDPYMQYPHLRMRLWDQKLEPTSTAVQISRIDAHYAK